jgi:hypothetical protein
LPDPLSGSIHEVVWPSPQMRPLLSLDNQFKSLSIAINATHGETVVEI